MSARYYSAPESVCELKDAAAAAPTMQSEMDFGEAAARRENSGMAPQINYIPQSLWGRHR